MSKPARIVVGASSAILLVVVLGVFVLRAGRPGPAAPVAPTPVVVATPSDPARLAVEPNPPLPIPLGAGPKLRKSAEPGVGMHLGEASLLAKLHDLAASDPPLSLQLAREAVQRFPDSPNAPEFAWNVVKALVNMGRRDEAKEEARVMVKKYPGNYFAGDVEHHLLNHPPNPK